MPSPWETEPVAETAVIKINGVSHAVKPTDSFGSTVKAMAAAKGLHKFTVLVDGSELNEGRAPRNFSGIKVVEIKKYDEAA